MPTDPVRQTEPGAPAIRALPPLETAPSLPRPLTSFVGRERETAAVAELLARDDVRLLTLTGPGGIGKTRLALRVAERVGAAVDHTWFVPLGSIRDAGHVAPAISRGLGILQDTPRPLGLELAQLMRGGSGLLILDNFEQVLDAWPLVADLLAACPALSVLVTSRTPLRISGEREYAVPPMALPTGEAADVVGHADAVTLFVERARAHVPAFALDATTAEAVAGICRELDGLPLAIELAAARVAVFSPATIRDRLDTRLALLAEGPRDQPPRLRSMRDSIAWSHDLLDAHERVLFRRLAVFAGAWTLAAAEAVAGDGAAPVFEGIAALVGDSLVRKVDELAGESRYAMLETIREFAAERLAESGEEAAIRDRHAAWCGALAAANRWGWVMLPEAGTLALRRLEAAHADVRAALGWLRQSGDTAGILELAGDLAPLWTVCGHLEEGRFWLESTLATAGGALPRGQALAALGWTCVLTGRSRQARDIATQGVALLAREGPSPELVQCLTHIAMASRQLGDFDATYAHLREAMAVLERIDATTLPAGVARNWHITLEAGLGHSAVMQGDITGAAEHYGRARDRQVAGGHAPGASHIYGSHVLAGLGDVARAAGHPAEALGHYRTSLEQAWRSGDARGVAHTVGGIAGALAALGRHDEAATLFGAAEAIHDAYGYRFDLETLDRQRALGLPEPWARAGEPCGVWGALRDAVTAPRRRLPPLRSPDAAAARWGAGRRLSPEAAVAAALAVESGPEPAPSPAALAGLSTREVEVLRLMVDGRTDNDIAGALFISRRTVATHVRHIYDKLGVTSRAAAVARAVRSGIA